PCVHGGAEPQAVGGQGAQGQLPGGPAEERRTSGVGDPVHHRPRHGAGGGGPQHGPGFVQA
ncbi:unnamed protein product, partial [Lota lota]